MNLQTHTLRAYQNLRAYHRSCTLASDVFWISRRFPQTTAHTLKTELRRNAEIIPERIAKGWNHKHNIRSLKEHLEGALDACVQLAHWLNVAKACQALSDKDHAMLMHNKEEVEYLIQRLERITSALSPKPNQLAYSSPKV